jgi:CRP/FNR family transcriptional regulator, nitrogen fixation regulation protein
MPPLMLAARSFDLEGAATAFSRNEEVFGEGEPVAFLYKVTTGCVRTYKTLKDGRRQIGAFYLPGDIFGLEARKVHNVSAEAITRSRLQAIKITELMSRIPRSILVNRLLLDLTTEELQRTQSHILLLLMSAQQRVIGFLLDMARREESLSEVELPMSRQDIADYLGLTIETVSRTLTRLETASTITLPTSRRVILCDRQALNRLMA